MMRPIWFNEDEGRVKVIDQRALPHQFLEMDLLTVDDVIFAIQDMVVRGAPLIGVTGAYGVYIAATQAGNGPESKELFQKECERLKRARPTAINLVWGIDMVLDAVASENDPEKRACLAKKKAGELAELEAENCRLIGKHGLPIIQEISRKKNGKPVNILTHCNAGWLACIEYGTATAPMYAAFDSRIDIHIWVDETRPLNQGARLTAWELSKHGIPHSVIADNTGGHLMQHGLVDIVIVGTDRTTAAGDVANKIGTYLKALAAWDNDIPFYVALPSSTFDFSIKDGLKEIPIEERNPDEIRFVRGYDGKQSIDVLVSNKQSHAVNYAFDVTPAKYVTGFITERGMCRADETDIRRLFPEKMR